MLIAFNKPFGVVCNFRLEPGRRTLADYIEVSGVYPAGRLDTDSEGRLLLTDDGGAAGTNRESSPPPSSVQYYLVGSRRFSGLKRPYCEKYWTTQSTLDHRFQPVTQF